MDETNLSRRALLSAAGGGVLTAIAGCSRPGGDAPATAGGTASTGDVDYRERADGSVYTEVYEDVLDSVALVSVAGLDDPTTGEETEGQGSAFVYDDDHVVTNEHVVWGGESIELQYPNGDWTGADVVGTDVYSDLAVLEVAHHPDVADPLEFVDVLPAVGQEVLAIGNPFGFEGSMSSGIVSGVNRSLPGPAGFEIPNVVQTDAGVNPGNSGGPLVDMDGDVVGVISAGVGETVGFAISAALAQRVVPSLLERGEYRHARIGIRLQEVDPAVAAANDLDDARGVLVIETQDDGPAEGILQGSEETVVRDGDPIPVGGDVVVALDGEETPDRHALSMVLALETSPGDEVEVEVIRDGERVTEVLELGSRPTDPWQSSP